MGNYSIEKKKKKRFYSNCHALISMPWFDNSLKSGALMLIPSCIPRIIEKKNFFVENI